MQSLYEPGRSEPLLLLGAGQIELQTLGLRLHAEGIPFEGDADAHGLVELLFVALGDAQRAVDDLHEGLGAYQIEILLCGSEPGVSLLRRRARIAGCHELMGLQGREDGISHGNLRRQISAGRITVLRDVEQGAFNSLIPARVP